jgi:hypothetical protein
MACRRYVDFIRTHFAQITKGIVVLIIHFQYNTSHFEVEKPGTEKGLEAFRLLS